MFLLGSHPKALPILFLTEMWERFGFYVVQGLLVLYMTGYFGLSDSESYTIAGVFTALVFISPLAGGFIASKVLGFHVAVIWGGLFLILGYALLALPFAHTLLYPALATIIVGNGLFKPNISSLLGTQYAPHDYRRDAGFTIFYVGINIGAFLAGMSSGYIKDAFGWRASFALAAMGLVIGLVTFIYGLKYIHKETGSNAPTFKFSLKLIMYCLLAIVGVNFLLRIQTLADWLLPSIGIFLIVALIVLTMQQEMEYRKRMLVLNLLILSSIVFWMLFLQIFYSANLFIERLVDKNFLGMHLSTTVFYASESIFILILGPLFAHLWEVLSDKDKNPTAVTKFVLGILFAGLGFLALGCSAFFPNSQGLIHPAWVFFSYFLITIGELLLSPIGLSAVTMLAPTHLVGLMMGVWFVATGFGGVFAGMLAKLSSVPPDMVLTSDKVHLYQQAFFDYACLAFFVAIILFFVQLALKKLLHSAV